jgi:Kdo2-lipid IVA lauroyltransferase/acyltransferase
MIAFTLYLISLIPLRILYLLSDIFSYLLYNLFKYRRKVVSENISKSLRDLNYNERTSLEKQFYKNFCDNFFETLKLLSMSEKNLQTHITADYSELENILALNQNCHIYLGHQFNWEWANAHIGSTFKKTNIVVAYKPLSNKSINNVMFKIRSRFGSKMVPSQNMKKEMKAFIGKQHVLILVADQNPNVPNRSFWTSFLSQPTAFISGTELYSASKKNPILFAKIIREKRGHYKFVLTPIFNFSQLYNVGLITKIFTQNLESAIVENPENYLWSHKRWKHIYKKEYHNRWLNKSIEIKNH